MKGWSTARQTGELLLMLGLFMAVPGVYGLVVADASATGLLASAAAGVGAGLLLSGRLRALGRMTAFTGRGDDAERAPAPKTTVSVPRALVSVLVGWLAVVAAGSTPFFLGGGLNWVDAVFESASAFTTTGATSLPSVRALSPALLLWRSLLQWLGGMGIIVLFLSFFPRVGVSGLVQFRAEVPGPAPPKALPRLSASSKLLWTIYVALTAAAFLALWAAGLSPFDAVNHALATLSTGGFSTVDGGPAQFSTAAQWVLVLFMFLGGTNLVLQHRMFRYGDWRSLAGDGEFAVYAGLQLGAGFIIALALWLQGGMAPAAAFRSGLFQAVATVTTTGYTSGDYGTWPALAQAVIFILLFVGGSAGSTAGGPKVVRLLIAWKYGWNQLRRFLLPRSVTMLRVGENAVPERVVGLVLAFLVLYFAVWFAGILGLAALGVQLPDALAASAAALGNVGTGFGMTGPAGGYGLFSPGAKLWLAALMIVGRLELLSILALAHPSAWTALRRPSPRSSQP